MCRRRNNQDNTNESTESNSTYTLGDELSRAWTEVANKPWDEVVNSVNGTLNNLSNSFGDLMSEPPRWGHRSRRHTELTPLPDNVQCTDYAYPTPTTKQYGRCLDHGGKGVWDRQGMWNCLVPTRPGALEGLGLGTQDQLPLESRNWFQDYTVYLDWDRAMKKATQAHREKQRQERRERHRLWQEQQQQQQQQVFSSVDPSNYVREDEATGKKVESVQINSNVEYRDGSLQVKKVVKKWYDDGTMSVSETINGKDASLEDAFKTHLDDSLADSPNPGTTSSGWFWK